MVDTIRNRKGFTLVELMIVVAIIGILAAIAIPNFMQFRLKAKTAEAKSNLGAIRSTEIAYFAEWNFYVGNQPFTPVINRTGNPNKVAWDKTTKFSMIGFAPEGAVFYSYEIWSPGSNYPTGAGFILAMAAVADLDADRMLGWYWIWSNANEILAIA